MPPPRLEACATGFCVAGPTCCVCTAAAMKADTRPTVDTSTWEITAIAFSEGDRGYFHCFAKDPELGETTTSAFGS
nr:hypothetical protein GCM10017745_13820 [Saccharothrix mutabilis subsp. capreolus]